MNLSIFKAYDVRGKYPEEINDDVSREISAALANYFLLENKKGAVVVGRDARLSSPSIYNVVIKEISGHGLEVFKIGLVTTPMFYFLVSYFNAIGGIMITASHNPKEFNGLKAVRKNAEMISGEEIKKLMGF